MYEYQNAEYVKAKGPSSVLRANASTVLTKHMAVYWRDSHVSIAKGSD